MFTKRDLASLTTAALATFTITLAAFYARLATAGDPAPSPITTVATPTLHTNDFDLYAQIPNPTRAPSTANTLALPPGPMPAFQLVLHNNRSTPVKAAFQATLQSTAPTPPVKAGTASQSAKKAEALQDLAQQNKLDVLSRPYILAQDNQEGYMQIGRQVPYVTTGWSAPYAIDLQPDETRTLDVDTRVNLTLNNNLFLTLAASQDPARSSVVALNLVVTRPSPDVLISFFPRIHKIIRPLIVSRTLWTPIVVSIRRPIPTFLGIIIGLAAALFVISHVSRAQPQPPMLPDEGPAIRAAVLQYSHGSDFVVPVFRQYLAYQSANFTAYLACPEESDFSEIRALLGDLACTLIPVYTHHPMTAWSRDRWVALQPLTPGTPGPITLLSSKGELGAEVWPQRAGDSHLAEDLARAFPRVFSAERSGLFFDGGDLLADGPNLFVTRNVLDRNLQHTVTTRDNLLLALQHELHLHPILMDDGPLHHAGMFMMSVGTGGGRSP